MLLHPAVLLPLSAALQGPPPLHSAALHRPLPTAAARCRTSRIKLAVTWPELPEVSLPAKLMGFGRKGVSAADRPMANELLSAAQAALNRDPNVGMELGSSLTAGVVFSSASSTAADEDGGSMRLLCCCFQVMDGALWAQATARGVSRGGGPVELVELRVAKMEQALMGESVPVAVTAIGGAERAAAISATAALDALAARYVED